MIELYNTVSKDISKVITQSYSTSFTMGIKTLAKKLHAPIYAIYGYVRLADEIVDSFYGHDQALLFEEFKADTYKALERGVSTNPVIHAFQQVVHQYNIDHEFIDSFLASMEMDLHHSKYDDTLYNSYIYGSAEVVGLMCLHVFCEGDKEQFNKLKEPARLLGAAFQKVNFLRDMQSDYEERGRVYFPGMSFTTFDEAAKREVEANIQADFDAAYKGILLLPDSAKFGVYLAYVYYLALFEKIKRTAANVVKQERIRVSDSRKVGLLVGTYLRSSLNIL